jgi:hypothetical protein
MDKCKADIIACAVLWRVKDWIGNWQGEYPTGIDEHFEAWQDFIRWSEDLTGTNAQLLPEYLAYLSGSRDGAS